MDLLFSSVERVFDLLRRRVPWLALLVATLGWVAAMVAFGWLTRWASSYGPGSPSVAWSSGAFLVGSPLVLLLNVGARGIAGVPPVAWPLGFVVVVATLDELARRRPPPTGPGIVPSPMTPRSLGSRERA
ncbi:hypothetical protein ACIBTV_30285 [Micromonospora sp. NPDC049366]|uniref:hypothetical protein n=1 Tax=Micromonospora sp. NPDC049366 TaxID=3364271 RepID=UPI00379574FC